jgi:hypothetical protein
MSRRRTIVLLIVAAGAGFFLFAPVMLWLNYAGPQLTTPPTIILSAYRSPSCSVLGVGITLLYHPGDWSYATYLSCDPDIGPLPV